MGAPIIIVGGITYGVFTATEASVIAVVYSTFLGMVVYRTLGLREFWRVLGDTAVLSSLTLFCIGISAVFGYLIGFYRVPVLVAGLFQSIASSPQAMLILIVVIFTVVGTFLDATPAIIVLMPMIAPIAHGAGIHPVHLGVVVVLTLALGLVTPPYGLCLLLGCSIARTTLDKVMGTVLVFTAVMWAIIILVAMVPEIALFLPRLIAPKLLG
jgi:tripartite ATP-independent transporter DctM subunit